MMGSAWSWTSISIRLSLNLKAARAIADKIGIGRLSEYDNWEESEGSYQRFFPVLRTYGQSGLDRFLLV